MDFKELTQKTKEFTLFAIDAQEKAAKTFIAGWDKHLGTEYATYTYGVTTVVEEVSNNARKIVEDCSGFAYAGNKK